MAKPRQPVKITPKVMHRGSVWSIFSSMNECAKELGIQESHISEVANGKRKTTHGYRFEKVIIPDKKRRKSK